MAQERVAGAPRDTKTRWPRRRGRTRRTFLVDRSLQLRFILTLVLTMAVAIAMVVALAWYERGRYDTLALACGRPPSDPGIGLFIAGMTSAGLTLAGALAVIGLVMTHRVAGPLVYVSNILRQVARGERPLLRSLREGDELTTFFSDVTAMVAALESREREEVAQVQVAMEAMRGGEERLAVSALQSLIDDKQGRLGDMR
jgi:hypothetical protein